MPSANRPIPSLLRAAGLILAAAAASACVPALLPEYGSRLRPVWRQLDSDHFRLATDLAEADAERMIRDLELLRALLVEATGTRGVPERLEVIAYAAGDGTGVHHRADLGREWIELSGVADDRVLLAHELAHAFEARTVAVPATWYAEGNATYLSSLAHVSEAGTASAGGPVHGWVARELRRGLVPVRALLGWNASGFRERDRPQSATSWLLVRFLRSERRAAFDELRGRLARGEHPQRAWDATFPEWSLAAKGGPERLDRLLESFALEPLRPEPAVRAEVSPRVTARVWTEAEAAALDPRAPEAWKPAEAAPHLRGTFGDEIQLVSTSREPDRGLARARAQLAALPEDPGAWIALAAALPAWAEADREAAIRKAVDVSSWRGDTRAFLATYLARRKPEEAAREATRAIELAPWSVGAYVARASALWTLRRCDEAAANLERIAQLRWRVPRFRTATEDLRQAMQQRCRDP